MVAICGIIKLIWENIAKILGHKDISMLVEVYGHTLQEKINEEFNNVRKLYNYLVQNLVQKKQMIKQKSLIYQASC